MSRISTSGATSRSPGDSREARRGGGRAVRPGRRIDSEMRRRWQVHLQHGDHHPLLHLDHLGGVLDEAVGELADVHQAVLVHADVHEGAERRSRW